MQHERFFALAGQAIDDLRIASRSQRRDDQRLRFTAGEQRRAVGSRQYAGADVDGAHGLGIAAVDARLAVQNLLAHEPIFEVGEFRAHLFRRELRGVALGQGFDCSGLDLLDLGVALLLLRERVRCGDVGLRERTDRRQQFLVRFRGNPRPLRFACLGRQLVDCFDGDLHLFVAERDGAEHDFLVEAVGFRFHH
jgi:hypothetical protein